VNDDLAALFTELGAVKAMPADDSVLHFGNPNDEYTAARERAVVVDRSNRGKLRFTGEDCVPFLHGMLTNTVQGLSKGSGNHSALTDVKGNTQADFWLHRVQEGVRVETEPGIQEKIAAFLDRYIIADDVEIKDETDNVGIISVQGPESQVIVERLVGSPVKLDLNGNVMVDSVTGVEFLARRSYTGEDGYDLWVKAADTANVFRGLMEAGAVPAGQHVLEILRVESGVPRYGLDVDDRVVPLEGGLADTVDFTKGCFIGQEVLGKMKNIGKPRRYMVGILLEGLLPPETELSLDGKVVGLVKSSAQSLTLGRTIGLASVRRGAEEPGTRFTVENGGTAEVALLPFVEGKSLTINDLNVSS
jgi:folate-binding protein YgfZ